MNDDGHAKHIADAAAHCICCWECWMNPCDGCYAGGVCDAMPCRCHIDEEDEEDEDE